MSDLHFAVLLARGTNPTEFTHIRLRLAETRARVTVVGLGEAEYELEDHSIGRADAAVDDVIGEPFDGIFVPGGLGPEKLRQHEGVLAVVRSCHERGKLCAAICHGQQVLISAGLMRGVRATGAWSMLDDLRAVGAIVSKGERAVRDGQIVTAVFPRDLPAFFHLVFEALADLSGHTEPPCYPARLAGQTWAIVIDPASDGAQVRYMRLRIREDGGTALLVGRRVGDEIQLGSPRFEWGEMGWSVRVDRALADEGAVLSCDSEAELESQVLNASDIDGLILPGGLGTWMIRGHPGLRALIRDVDQTGKPIVAVGRGPKLLLSAGVLAGRDVTCAPQMRDDLCHAVAGISCRDEPVVRDDNLWTCQRTDDLPDLMVRLLGQEP